MFCLHVLDGGVLQTHKMETLPHDLQAVIVNRADVHYKKFGAIPKKLVIDTTLKEKLDKIYRTRENT